MNKAEVLKRFKAVGAASARKTYARYGIMGVAYGVRYVDHYPWDRTLRLPVLFLSFLRQPRFMDVQPLKIVE